MSAVVLYFHVHQPYRIRRYDMFKIGDNDAYFDSSSQRLDNKKIFKKVANKCYYPTNKILLDLLNAHKNFQISFSISGVFIDQLKEYEPELLKSFQELFNTGKVELVSETYHHSLAALYSDAEFSKQIELHQEAGVDLFNQKPTSFRNTELIYNNHIAQSAEKMGYQTILAEGVDRYLGWRSPNFVYQPEGTSNIRLLLKNYKLSDDIAFRFSSKEWEEWPLTTEKYASWINNINGNGDLINLFMDYETFGEHQWSDTGIFDFLHHLPTELMKHPDNTFMTVSQASHAFPIRDVVDMPETTSWADVERDTSAWTSNPMQQEAIKTLFDLEKEVLNTKDDSLITDWRRLTTSDHFYYMCTKWFADGDVHKYFSPNHTPYEAYVHYMNVLQDLRQRVYAYKVTN